MSSYGYQNKYKTIAWDSVGRLESDYEGGFEKHDQNVAKAVPKITYTEGGEEYYPQVACSWHKDEYNIEFKNQLINIIFNDHWKEPKTDEKGYYEYDQLEDEETVKLVKINKEKNSIKRYKVVLESEEEITDLTDKVKYELKVEIEEAVKYWLEKSKTSGSTYVAGYFNDLRQFIPVNRYGYGKAITIDYIKDDMRNLYSDCRYPVIITKDSSWEEIKKQLGEKGYISYISDVKINGQSICSDNDIKERILDEDLPF